MKNNLRKVQCVQVKTAVLEAFVLILSTSVFSYAPVDPQQCRGFTPTTYFAVFWIRLHSGCVKFSRSLRLRGDEENSSTAGCLQVRVHRPKNKDSRVQQKNKILQL